MAEAGVLQRGGGHGDGPHDRRRGGRRAGDAWPAGGAPAVRPAEGDGGLRDPARQCGPGGMRRQARRPRAPPAHGPRAGVRRRGGGDEGGAGEGDRGGRRGRDPRRGTRGRPGDARDAGGDRGDRGRGPRRVGGADHRRALLGRDARLHGGAYRARGRQGRPDRGAARRGRDHDRRRHAPDRREADRRADRRAPARLHAPARTRTERWRWRFRSTRSWWAAPPRAQWPAEGIFGDHPRGWVRLPRSCARGLRAPRPRRGRQPLQRPTSTAPR